MMEKYVFRQWGERFGLATRLSEFLSTPQAQALVRAFRASDADEEPDPEVIPFLLLHYVWPEKEWGTVAPLQNAQKNTARQLRMTAHLLRVVSDTIKSEPPLTVPAVEKQLDQWAAGLEAPTPVHLGSLTFYGRPPSRGRHRAKRQVVFFLTGYFESLGRTRAPWPVITEFLIVAGLATSGTDAKQIATWWSNLLKREVTPEGTVNLTKISP